MTWRARHRRTSLAILIVATFSTTAARVAHAYRPFDGTDAAVAELGELELEVGPVGYLRLDDAQFFAAPALVANLGFAKRFELVAAGRELVGLGDVSGEPRSQFVDTGLFVKMVLREGALQEQTGWSIATEVGALLPEVNGESGAGLSAAVIASQMWSVGTLHANFAASRTRAGNPDLFAGVILEGPVGWTVRPVVELFYEREFRAAQSVSGLGGFIARVADDLAFDAALRFSRADTTNVAEVRAGFTWAMRMWGAP